MAFIIAEVGSNWSSFEDCVRSIAYAKATGADAVKFQLFTGEALYGQPKEMKGALPIDWIEPLARKSLSMGIEFMCSAFSPELLEIVDPWVTRHKVASAEMCHVRMLERLAQIGKPVILSTGSHNDDEITRAIDVLNSQEGLDITLLYCVAAYPTRFVNFERMKDMQFRFGEIVGFSDHTTDIAVIPKMAQDLGATVLEKHVNFVGATGPDAPHSLNTDEFKAMVKVLRGEPVVFNEENDMVTTHNRRLIAITDIREGQMLKEGVNFGIYRAQKPESRAMSPFCVNLVNGRPAKRAIAQGEGIGPDCV